MKNFLISTVAIMLVSSANALDCDAIKACQEYVSAAIDTFGKECTTMGGTFDGGTICHLKDADEKTQEGEWQILSTMCGTMSNPEPLIDCINNPMVIFAAGGDYGAECRLNWQNGVNMDISQYKINEECGSN